MKCSRLIRGGVAAFSKHVFKNAWICFVEPGGKKVSQREAHTRRRTSNSHGLSLRSKMMSKPRTSKQTLSLPGGWPGRHMRYACSTWGSATINVFTTSSWQDKHTKKQRKPVKKHTRGAKNIYIAPNCTFWSFCFFLKKERLESR